MDVLFFDLKGRVRATRFPDPTPGDHDVLVRTTASVISTGTETHGLRQNRRSLLAKIRDEDDLMRRALDLHRSGLLLRTLRMESPTGAPFSDRLRKVWPLGYSAAGVVIEAGKSSGFAAGDRVACAGHPHADLLRVPRSLTVKTPDALTDEAAAFAAVGAIALRGIHRAQAALGDVVVVIGLGLIGLLSVQMLRAYGVTVVGVDPVPARRALAKRFGAARAFAPDDGLALPETLTLGHGRGADAVLVTAGTESSGPLALAGQLIGVRGRAVVVGATGLTLPRGDFYRKEADVLISRSYGPGRYDAEYEEASRPYPDDVRWDERRNLAEFVRLAAGNAIDPVALVSQRTAFADAPAAYDRLLSAGSSIVASAFTYDAASTTPSEPPPVIEVAASPIPAAVVGHGDFARRVLMPRIAGSGEFSLRTVVGRNRARASDAAAAHAAAGTDRFDDVLDDPEVKAIFVLTRHDLHASMATRALEAGKAVFVEKPLALTLPDAERIVDLARSMNLPVAVGFNRRHSRLAAKAREVAARRATPAHAIFRVAGTFLPATHWVYDPAVGGGRVVGEACHFVDFLRWVLGEEIVSLSATGGNWTHPGTAITDNFTAALRFASGSAGTLVYGDLGRADFPKERFELFTGEVALALEDFHTLLVAGEPDASVRLDQPDKGFEREVHAFARWIRTGEPGACAGAVDGLEALRWSLAIEDAIHRGESSG